MPTPSKAQDSAFRYMSTSDQQTSLNSPCSWHSFFITRAPPSSYSTAGMIFTHSGHSDPVLLGRPLRSLEGMVTVAPASLDS